MAVRFYDEALLNKLKRWTQDTQVMITGVNETQRLFEVVSDMKDDRPIQLPLIALSRPGGFTIQQTGKQSRTYDSATMIVNEQRSAKLNMIPISIPYQLDIYTRYLEEADEYIRNIVFNIINYPKLTIEIPYEDSGLVHDANIRLNPEITNNSDIPERLIPGQFTRYTVEIEIDDAYLFDVRVKDNLKIVEGQVNTVDPDKLHRELIFQIQK